MQEEGEKIVKGKRFKKLAFVMALVLGLSVFSYGCGAQSEGSSAAGSSSAAQS